ncbi:MBL fold metallo-hydrolase [Roseibium aestuarii]|uniref:MBL fold metallo-hydrolase n=1 Tax=Roseibium aestuarii TaxID=2600299 RepID=A0ABW4JWV9_9HYPH|nr:MBL fold metallo-hydrolase [Roseibium aestuarii]
MDHQRAFEPAYGTAVEVADGIRRMTVRNPGPFTFHGTNTYLIGTGDVAILDPGPDNAEHLEALLAATKGQRIAAILVSHTHMDHSPGARRLKAATGAPIIGCGPHRAARAMAEGEVNAMDASADRDHAPDQELRDGDRFDGQGFTLTALETPGHTANHLCLALGGTDILFSADHVMAWATSIVAPPDGSMTDYLTSLDRLKARDERLFLPGHGGPVTDAAGYMAQLKAHRLGRERSILAVLDGTARRIPEIVDLVYAGLDPQLKPAAALSVLAHLEALVERETVEAPAGASLGGLFRLSAS